MIALRRCKQLASWYSVEKACRYANVHVRLHCQSRSTGYFHQLKQVAGLYQQLLIRTALPTVKTASIQARAAAETMSASEGSGSKANAVVARLGEILQEVDMAITTQRQITNKLAEELGEDVYEYKALIRVSYCSEQQVVLMVLNDGVTVGQITGSCGKVRCQPCFPGGCG